MQFYSNEIQIEEGVFGCTLTFKEDETDYEKEMQKSVKELMNSTEKYILLQRTYSEGGYENDYYYFEPSNFDKAGELKDFIIDLHQTRFELKLKGDFYQVQFKADSPKFEQLKSVLKIITNGRGSLNIHST